MAAKYYKTKYPGVRYRLHPDRKHGLKFDRYFAIYYIKNGKRIDEGCGWASKEWTAEKAAGELARLKHAHRTGRGPQTMKEARDIAEQERKALELSQEQEDRNSTTFGKYFEKVYLPAQTLKTANVLKTEKGYINNWVNPVIGALPFNKISILHFQKIRKNMLEDPKKPKAMRSAQYAASISRQVWNHARASGYVNADFPFKKEMKKFKIDDERVRFLTPDEAGILLEALKKKSKKVANMSLLALHCGLRAGEIFNLKWSNINVDEGIINVFDAKAGSRLAFMTDQVKEMFKGLKRGKPGSFIFKNTKGKKIVDISTTFSRVVDDLKLNEGIKDRREKFVFHSLRHSFASNLAQQGVSLYVIQKLMGHKTISLTERYSHLSNDSLKNAVNILEQAMKPKIIQLDSNVEAQV
jgi:integrase